MTRSYQTMAEIEKQYPNEWVIIDQPKTTKYQAVLGGYVVYHGTDRLPLYEFLKAMPIPRSVAVLYLGPALDEDEELLLDTGLSG